MAGSTEFSELIESVAGLSRRLVVGDAIIDEYQYVLPMHKPPKENMIATRYPGPRDIRRRRVCGGQSRGFVLQAG